MGKIISYYNNGVDKCWYTSSNVVYSECIDHKDALKDVKIVFKNGTEYTYKEVPVYEYMTFRESASQGKALNSILKKYEFVKSEEKRDLELIKEEMEKVINLANQ